MYFRGTQKKIFSPKNPDPGHYVVGGNMDTTVGGGGENTVGRKLYFCLVPAASVRGLVPPKVFPTLDQNFKGI